MRSLFVLIGASLLFACGDRQPESPASNPLAPLAPAGKVTENPSERAVLIAFYKATGGANWKRRGGWNSDAPLSQWRGVKADDQGRVKSLVLAKNGLTGAIPAELGQLKNLQRLDLSFNGLAGAIPAELGQLKNLQYLSLSGNGLTGEIPAELGQLKNLQDLDLGGNQLTGEIPAELGQLKNLQYLYLGGNQLTGCIPADLQAQAIPLALFRARPLQHNELGKFGFDTCDSATDDDSVTDDDSTTDDDSATDTSDRDALTAFYNATGGDGWKKRTGWLSDAPLNQWQGVTTDDHGRVTGLNLIRNRLTGEIPEALGKLANLQTLKLIRNQLTGKIPEALGKLEKLQTLKLRDNQLTGCIPAVLQAQAIPNHDLGKLGLAFCE